MAIDVWMVDKDDAEGYTTFVDLCETFDEAVEAVFEDWKNSRGSQRWHAWLTEPEENSYAPGRGFYIYEYLPTTPKRSTLSYTYYLYHFTKSVEDNHNGD